MKASPNKNNFPVLSSNPGISGPRGLISPAPRPVLAGGDCYTECVLVVVQWLYCVSPRDHTPHQEQSVNTGQSVCPVGANIGPTQVLLDPPRII